MDTSAHDDAVREQFQLQASTFTDVGWATSGLEWITELLAPRPAEQVLDIAAGAAHLGRALAPHVGHVSAVDLTPEMLEQGRRLAAADGLTNVVFAVGDAAALPWIDDQFDLVVCRLTIHQVADPAAVVSEMLRVTRPTGRVAVTDMVADPDPAVAVETNRLERLRDPSHGRTRTLDELRGLLEAAGASIASTTTRDNPVDLEDWMRRTSTPETDRAHIRARLSAELDGDARTGLRARRGSDGALGFTHTWATFTARPGTSP